MDGIKRRGASATINHSSSVDHRRVQKSTTLNRKFVKRPNLSRTQATTAQKAAQQTQAQRATQQQVQAQQAQRTTRQTQAQAIQIRKTATIQTRKQAATRATVTRRTTANQQQLIARQKRVRLQPISAAKTEQQQQQGVNRVSDQALSAIAKKQEIVSLANAQQQQTQSLTARTANQIVANRTNLSAQQQAKIAESPIARNARARVQYKNLQKEHISAREMKDKAIQKALHDVATMDQGQQEVYEPKRRFWQRKGFLVSGVVAVISVALLGYLVYLNLPDLSVRVAAMQTGIENAYPSYVPMNYRLDGLVKEDKGAITMNFVREDGGSFQLIEKKSSWDSATVLSNLVEEKWGSDYVVAKGQGLTIYISGSNAVWVNGGVLYQIEDNNSGLTTDDLHDIAISL